MDSKYKTIVEHKIHEIEKNEEKFNSLLKNRENPSNNESQIIEWFKKEKDLEAKIEKEQQEIKRLEGVNF